ncbi:Heterokaryon incompatibility [Ophiocordyceps sinensis CO18]|nr:Heterokaryon incompatibility [Ophiocordyceps sinensis CO18]
MPSSHYCLSAPTKEIRLVELLPATSSGRLAGRLRRAAIDNTPPFVSVSHVWGDAMAEGRMHLESGCGNKEVQISKNLEALLLSLLCHDSSSLPQLWDNGSRLPLWIDMVCINQTDIDEKTAQIALMRRIYSQATSALIWINEYDSHLMYAFRHLGHVTKAGTEIRDDAPWRLFDPIGWDCLKRLFECDWFQRRWVVQEAAIPRDPVLLCGSHVMTLNDLFRGVDIAARALVARPKEIKMLKFATVGPARPIFALKELRRALSGGKGHQSLLWLLEDLRSTRATLAHDQVYGLLGLCSLQEASGNPIRYHVDAEEVYRSSVESHARIHNDLDFLGLCTPVQRDELRSRTSQTSPGPFKGPSWVPNWHSTRLRRCLGLHGLNRPQTLFNAPGAMVTTYRFKANELAVTGTFVGKINLLGDFCEPGRRAELSDPNSKLFQQYFDFWMKPAEDPESTPYPDAVSRAEAFARTLSLLGVCLDPVPSPDVILAMFYNWCRGSSLGRQLGELGFGSRFADPGQGRKTFMRMKRLLSWQPFITDRGCIGLAREQCSVGDEIWIVAGCSVPIVLSPSVEFEGRKQVRGESFLDGFMFGEKTSGQGASAPEVEIITLV